jgi:glutathione S-transferase
VFEKQLEKNNTGYLVGDKLTWLDFYVACFYDYCVTYGPPDSMDKFKRLGKNV